jgi:hypothetical protein
MFAKIKTVLEFWAGESEKLKRRRGGFSLYTSAKEKYGGPPHLTHKMDFRTQHT